jgi:hypothetical protein
MHSIAAAIEILDDPSRPSRIFVLVGAIEKIAILGPRMLL